MDEVSSRSATAGNRKEVTPAQRAEARVHSTINISDVGFKSKNLEMLCKKISPSTNAEAALFCLVLKYNFFSCV